MVFKILSTAKLPNIKGSPKVRQELAANLNKKFADMTNQILEKNGFITKNDLKDVYEKIAPNVHIEIKDLPLEKVDTFGGSLNYELNEDKNIKGFSLTLPFKNSKLCKESIGNLNHENDHFVRAITEPKYTAANFRNNTSMKNNTLAAMFYDQIIYAKEKNKFDANGFKKLTDFLFQNGSFSANEKIKSLLSWIRRVDNETRAYITGISAEFGDNFKQNLESKNSDETKILSKMCEEIKNLKIKKTIKKQYCFNEKRQTLKEIFLDEIATNKLRIKQNIEMQKYLND